MEGPLNFESAGIAKVRSGFLLVMFITIIIGTLDDDCKFTHTNSGWWT